MKIAEVIYSELGESWAWPPVFWGRGQKKTVEGLRRCLLGLFWFSWYHGQDPGKVLFVNQIPTIGLMLHKSLPSYLDFH